VASFTHHWTVLLARPWHDGQKLFTINLRPQTLVIVRRLTIGVMLKKWWLRVLDRLSTRRGWPIITPPTVPPAGPPKFSDRARTKD
jgi:hypothetical protein